MADGTAIEWADDSWNPIRARVKATGALGHYCVKISPGCKNCYAERLQSWPIGSKIRYAAQDLEGLEVFLDEEVLEAPLKRRRPRIIFPCSMTDLFAAHHPDAWISEILNVAYACPQHRFLVLTKRVRRMVDFIAGSSGQGLANADFFRNVWFGFSAENQEEWNERWGAASELAAHGFNVWASCEPLLSDIRMDLMCQCGKCGGDAPLSWLVVGGESGPGARPTVIGHIRGIVQQCLEHEVPVFVKQLGSKPVNREGVPHRLKHKKGGDPSEWPEDLRVRVPAGWVQQAI